MADQYGAPCIQSNKALEDQPIKHKEDCLHLNIWTPAKSAADRLPVMFWIHRGGFTAGEGKVAKTARDLSRDASFGWATWTWARLQTKTGKSKAFLYYFDQHPDHPPDSPRFGWGAPHAAECPFVFQHLELRANERTPGDQALSETIVAYWTNFAKRGDPNGPGLPNWPAFDPKLDVLMNFSDTPTAQPAPHKAQIDFIDEWLAIQRRRR